MTVTEQVILEKERMLTGIVLVGWPHLGDKRTPVEHVIDTELLPRRGETLVGDEADYLDHNLKQRLNQCAGRQAKKEGNEVSFPEEHEEGQVIASIRAEYQRHRDPYQVMLSIEFQTALEQTLAGYDEDEQDIFTLHVVERMSFAAIARELGLSRETVRQRYIGIIRRLRETLYPFA